ncbi:2-dehydro-3-deoxy-6-phosphogalactonate aldolase [Arenicella xantha]|uniref:2-keto-3-deoxy-phosphogalactonate aldolase n=1 Tax=Arenicella xantha TaxID=644221 RepID=A0A395JLI2_9GAMM|nr:2-dehydro-3-deoxy-6-phosphogalactonate aldolase [Arenicella xantha]RBP51622.1 2-keto-3-deoxy-phosphogalactonate aldolase [Arenicella xantha]
MNSATKIKLDTWLDRMPVIAIIRGVKPDEVVEIGTAIHRAGIGIIEVPLNSPDPFNSIERLSNALGDECITGCGTLVNVTDAQRVADAGGSIAVTPNSNVDVIHACIESELIPMPGWATPTEAYAAYQAGAKYLKLFPAATYGSGHIKAVRAILPSDVTVLAVGGVGAQNASEWLDAGVDGFGIGSEIYRPGDSAEVVFNKASAIVSAIRTVKKS